jgi:Helix-hairpin-helix motif
MNTILPPSVFYLFWVVFCSFFSQTNYAQTDSLMYSFQDAIESTVAANDDAPFDYDTEFDHLADFIRHPLNINTASAAQFEHLRLLSSTQIQDIIRHREQYGRYLTLYELQTVLNVDILKKILPFVTIDGDIDDVNLPLKKWFSAGKTQILSRYERRLEKSRGFTEGVYQGDANRLLTRFRYQFAHNLSCGLTLEKDAGERFNQTFASGHFQLNKAHKLLTTIVLGDFSASLGQGLIHDNGFALGKSAMVLSIERDKPPIRAYTSSNEYNFMRGIATVLKLGQNTEGVLFASYRRRDGNLETDYGLKPDSTDDESVIAALKFTGLHRYKTELEDQNQVGLITLGGHLKHDFKTFEVGLNSVFNHFDKRIFPQEEPYNIHYFQGKNLLNTSVDYRGRWQNIAYFGETALSGNGGFATLNGWLVGLGKQLSISVLQRFFSKNYQTINAQPFAESSRVQGEKGLYVGIQFRQNRAWTHEFYADIWRYDWQRFRVDAIPSFGNEWFLKTSFRRRNTDGYVQLRLKRKQENLSPRPDTAKTNTVVDKSRFQIRFQINHHFNKFVELRNRVEWAFFQQHSPLVPTPSRGFAAWQDVLFKHPNTPLGISGRLAYFNTTDYQSAIYGFENDVTNSFAVLPYYFRGGRFYINGSYKFRENAHLEARLARTTLFNQKTIGSGFDEILGNKRTDFKLQLRLGF